MVVLESRGRQVVSLYVKVTSSCNIPSQHILYLLGVHCKIKLLNQMESKKETPLFVKDRIKQSAPLFEQVQNTLIVHLIYFLIHIRGAFI